MQEDRRGSGRRRARRRHPRSRRRGTARDAAPQPARAQCGSVSRPFGAPFFHPPCSSTASCSTTWPSLRPGLSRERGLRPLDAAARARRRRNCRGARPEARPSGAGVPEPQRRPALLFSGRWHCERSCTSHPSSGRRRPRRRGSWGAAGSGPLGSGGPLPRPPRCLRAASRRRPRGTRGRGESAPARGYPPRTDSASPIRHGSPPVGSDGDGKSGGGEGACYFLARSSSPPRRARCVSLSSLRNRRPTVSAVPSDFPLSPEVELAVIYAAQTVAGRTWSVEPRHRTTFLRGLRLLGLARLLHHDGPRHTGSRRAPCGNRARMPSSLGWSTFASQAAIAWSRRRGVPYVPAG